ncbi:sugar ABC transporter substrate-binding protein [Terrabacter sp. 2RAF25]|uniref:sugar ABC transporter substrate-binding protein n=1 Tax=Terrabacter sp. 2RAF25 TaxID=3232998 RepID=UPI003F9E8DB8
MSRPLFRSRPARALAASALAASLLGACGAGEKVAPVSAEATAAGAAGVQQAKESLAGWSKAPTWPKVTPIGKPVDLTGKKFTFVALGDQIPVIHAVGVGVTEALGAAGATVKICDGKFNPTAVADCLKAAGDEKVDGVISAFVDYQMAGPAFDALAAKGVKVIVGGVAPSGGRKADANLAFYDNTPRVSALHEAMSEAAIADGGTSTNVLWVRLMDSTTTTGASAQGIAKFKALCPSCGIAETEFTTANVDKLATSVSAALVSNPDTNAVIVPVDSFVPPVLQGILSAKFAGKVKVFSSSSDLAGLQRVKDGQQTTDLGTPVLFEGWKFANGMVQLLAGQEVEKGSDFVTRAFTKDNVGGLTLDAKTYLTDDWFGGGAYKQTFLSAWGVK